VPHHDGVPSPTSTYAISLPRTRRLCFWYGNAAEIMVATPSFSVIVEQVCKLSTPVAPTRRSLTLFGARVQHVLAERLETIRQKCWCGLCLRIAKTMLTAGLRPSTPIRPGARGRLHASEPWHAKVCSVRKGAPDYRGRPRQILRSAISRTQTQFRLRVPH
jgi:hypothetical protein